MQAPWFEVAGRGNRENALLEFPAITCKFGPMGLRELFGSASTLESIQSTPVLVAAALLVAGTYIFVKASTSPPYKPSTLPPAEPAAPKMAMSAPRTDLAPPKDDPFTLESLKAFDGSVPDKPIYVSIKGASCSAS